MAIISRNFTIWLHGLVAAAISAFATAGSAVITMPDIFNFSHEQGWINIAKLTLVPTAASVFAYLKKSPIPPPESPENGQVK